MTGATLTYKCVSSDPLDDTQCVSLKAIFLVVMVLFVVNRFHCIRRCPVKMSDDNHVVEPEKQVEVITVQPCV